MIRHGMSAACFALLTALYACGADEGGDASSVTPSDTGGGGSGRATGGGSGQGAAGKGAQGGSAQAGQAAVSVGGGGGSSGSSTSSNGGFPGGGGAGNAAGAAAGQGGAGQGGQSAQAGAAGQTQKACIPGQQFSCPCPGSAQTGVQTCADDGLSLGPCAGCPAGQAGAAGSAGSTSGGGNECQPPDFLIVLDRSRSMHRVPSGDTPPPGAEQTSRWWIAIDTIKTLVNAQTPKGPFDQTARFGLELFPRVSSGCQTLSSALEGTVASNVNCEPPELLVQPALSTGQVISASLDPLQTQICYSTPLGGALQYVVDNLLPTWKTDTKRKHSVLLLTDGRESCTTNSQSVAAVKALAAEGVTTFAVGFNGEVGTTDSLDPQLMNELACAGQTAKDFAQNCVYAGDGYVPSGAGGTLFLDAKDGAALYEALKGSLEQICCGCKL